ncbi:MAG: HAMP domain-containing protein [Actinobacteria bacterium]|nr:HAMP domain-containing protein [Actinomycetota bacterium]MBU1943207.1 HAMP domain-containing protein [Actinomycetota bacterium]MBU2686234.1 HAMP domain-containing protein [Actinomycetota bacterium]
MIILLLMVFLAFAISAGVIIWSDSATATARKKAFQSQDIVVQALRVGRNASEQKRDAREIVLDGKDEYADYEVHRNNVVSAFGKWQGAIEEYPDRGDLDLEKERSAALEKIRVEYDAMDGDLQSATQSVRSLLPAEARAALEQGLIADYETRFLPLVESVIEIEKPRAEQAVADADEVSRLGVRISLVTIGLLGIAVLLIAVMIVRDIISSVNKLGNAASRLGEDDLDARVDIEKRDEFGFLAQTFNTMAERLKSSKEELERMNLELKGFAHTVSHDLKGPLTSMTVAGSILEERVMAVSTEEERKDAKEMATIISRSTMSMARLIDDILALAEAGQQPREVSRVDVGEVVKRIMNERNSAIEERGIEVKLSEDLGHVVASEAHVYQVFTNLIGNAIKHNESAKPVIGVSYLGDDLDGGHRYLVRDNGSGIPGWELDKIFVPFFKGRTGETGIGLSTVENIIKVYGGEIQAYNDGGACFEFVLHEFEPDDRPIG